MKRGKCRFSYATEERLPRNLLYVVTSHTSSVLVSSSSLPRPPSSHPHMLPSRLRGEELLLVKSVGKARPLFCRSRPLSLQPSSNVIVLISHLSREASILVVRGQAALRVERAHMGITSRKLGSAPSNSLTWRRSPVISSPQLAATPAFAVPPIEQGHTLPH